QQSRLGLTWLESEIQTELGPSMTRPTENAVRASLRRIVASAPEATAVVYYVDDTGVIDAVGGGPMGAPRPPWYVRALIESSQGKLINLHGAFLTGISGRLAVTWHAERLSLGSIAVFYPSYRGRGESMVRPLKELLVFFLVLFGACTNI